MAVPAEAVVAEAVTVLEVTNGGNFIATPLVTNSEEEGYSFFLADLNNYMNDSQSRESSKIGHSLKRGEICAVYCRTEAADNEKFWYRGRILLKLKNVQGITAKVLLVDQGSIVCVPGQWIRRLEPKYLNFPIQMMTCQLYGLKPLTLAATLENLVSKQTANTWDTSAKTRLQELTKDAHCRLNVHYTDMDGTFHVTLFASTFDSDGRQNEVNVNELYVQEEYAQFEDPFGATDEARSTKDQNTSDDAASTISDSSQMDSEISQLQPEEFDRLMERKRIEEQRFQLRTESSLDKYRAALGLPPVETDTFPQDSAEATESENPKISSNWTAEQKASSIPMKMVPASCDDGVDLVDDRSRVDETALYKSRRLESEKLMKELMGIEDSSATNFDPTSVNQSQSPLAQSAGNLSSKNMSDMSDARRSDAIISHPISSGRPLSDQKSLGAKQSDTSSKVAPSSAAGTPTSSRPKDGPTSIWSKMRSPGHSSMSEGEGSIDSPLTRRRDSNKMPSLQSQSNGIDYTSDGSRASDDNQKTGGTPNTKGSTTTRGVTPLREMRYEKECLKQQFKNQVDENAFRPTVDSWELLKALGASPSLKANWKSPGNTETTESKNTALPSYYDDVLIIGENKPKPVTSIDELNVPMEMRNSLRDNNTRSIISKPYPVQAYAWPAIVRNRHVVGVDRGKSGKTLGYVLPILKQLVDTPECYKSLPKGTGPIVIILATDYNEARNICETCEKTMYSYRTKYKTKVLYGGRGHIQDEMVSLINGCSILVATVPSLVSMLEKGCTNLERLCHLVFDRADILVERFEDDIKILMRIYAESLSKKIALNLPHQMVAMAVEWSRGVESLLGAYFSKPLIIIADKLEASVYKQVKQYVEVCSLHDRTDDVMTFLQANPGSQVVLFVKSATEADRLEKTLESKCIAAITATEFMSPIELMDVKASWDSLVQSGKSDHCVLVMTDGVASRISIRNATCIIHYEFPTKKTEFGQRMNCLLGAMKTQDKNKTEDKSCCSLILITEENDSCAPAIAKLLKRARQHVPPSLQAIAERVEQQKEEKSKRCDICTDVKYYGVCRDKQNCRQRHTIFADSDAPKNIPRCGVAKVKILEVVSANVYWGRIEDHQLPFGVDKEETYDTKSYFKLAYDMQIYYANKANRQRHGSTAEGVLVNDVCVIKEKDVFKRVKVESITKRDSQTAIATEVYVFGIDDALPSRVSVENLLLLPQDKSFSLQSVPPQAIELIVCGVKPVEKSFSFTVEACLKIDKLISGKTLEGKIVLGLRNTLWLDPLIQKTKMDGLNALVTTLHVGSELLDLGFADKNRSHVKNLRDLCKDCLPDVVNACMESENKPKEERPEVSKSFETMELPEGDYQDVYVSAVEHPGIFYVQLLQSVGELDKLEDKIEAVMKVLTKHEAFNPQSLSPGSICLAKFTVDDKWYRAKVLEVNEDGGFVVFYVDHGEKESIPETRLWKAWPEILELPFQAIECSLVHVSPSGPQWSSNDGDALWNLCDGKLLVTQVKSKCDSEYAGEFKYAIDLFDTTGEHMINMSHELVFLGHALGSQDCIQEMFPDALWCPENRECTSELECVPDICLQIYLREVEAEKLDLARKLQRIVTDSESMLNELCCSGGIKSIAKLLSLCKEPELSKILLEITTFMASRDERVQEEMKHYGGLKAICSMLPKMDNDSYPIEIILALKSLASSNRNKSAVNVYGGITAICSILKEKKEDKVICPAVETLAVLCTDNDRNCHCVLDADGIEPVFDLMKSCSEEKLLEECTNTIAIISRNLRCRDSLRDLQGIDILGNMISKLKNRKCLANALETLKNATISNQLNREYIRKIGLIPSIERLLYAPLHYGLEVKRLSGELLTNIRIAEGSTGSGQKIVQVPKITPDDGPPPLVPMEELPCLSPKTLWSQRRKKVTVAVQLRGVVGEVINITERNVYFSYCTADHKYELDLELFKGVDPKESNWQVLGGEVLINLVKQEKFVWPRLLKAKIKPPYLRIDFDRWSEDLPDSDEDCSFITDPSSRSLPSMKGKDLPVKDYSDGVPIGYYSDVDSSDEDDDSDSDALYDDFGPIT